MISYNPQGPHSLAHRDDTMLAFIATAMGDFFAHAKMTADEVREFMDTLHHRHITSSQAYAEEGMMMALMDFIATSIVPHKIAVFDAGMAMGHSRTKEEWRWRLIVHDMSKLSFRETYGYWMKYGKNFAEVKVFETMGDPTYADTAYKGAWLHHIHHNSHHPEHWHLTTRDGEVTAIQMPEEDVFEMVADWRGASASYGGNFDEWLKTNLEQFLLHAETSKLLSKMLDLSWPA